ncbi:MAG: hypothetical protein IJ684_06705 [Bacteroidales bacterium]|nr:hypothetical protein [Bacteroidales bacterium]
MRATDTGANVYKVEGAEKLGGKDAVLSAGSRPKGGRRELSFAGTAGLGRGNGVVKRVEQKDNTKITLYLKLASELSKKDNIVLFFT